MARHTVKAGSMSLHHMARIDAFNARVWRLTGRPPGWMVHGVRSHLGHDASLLATDVLAPRSRDHAELYGRRQGFGANTHGSYDAPHFLTRPHRILVDTPGNSRYSRVHSPNRGRKMLFVLVLTPIEGAPMVNARISRSCTPAVTTSIPARARFLVQSQRLTHV